MKKYFSFLFCIFYSLLSAQTYAPFPTGQDSVAWKIIFGNHLSSQEKFQYFLGDSVLDGKNYTKVFYSDVLFSENDEFLVDLVREENKKVYSKNLSNGNEYLLYDFGMQVGDTVMIEPSDSIAIVLLSIDSVQLEDNTFRKRYKYFFYNEHFSDTTFQIEGLGNLSAGYRYPIGWHFLDLYRTTLCLFSPNSLFYNGTDEPEADCYVLKNDVAIKNIQGKELSIFPNPIKNYINFSEKITNSKLRIFNITGQVIFEEKAFSGIQLDVSFLKNGVYFLKLEGENSGYVKFIVN